MVYKCSFTENVRVYFCLALFGCLSFIASGSTVYEVIQCVDQFTASTYIPYSCNPLQEMIGVRQAFIARSTNTSNSFCNNPTSNSATDCVPSAGADASSAAENSNTYGSSNWYLYRSSLAAAANACLPINGKLYVYVKFECFPRYIQNFNNPVSVVLINQAGSFVQMTERIHITYQGYPASTQLLTRVAKCQIWLPRNTVVKFDVIDLRVQDNANTPGSCPHRLYVYEGQSGTYRQWCASQYLNQSDPLNIDTLARQSGDGENRIIDVVFTSESANIQLSIWIEMLAIYPNGTWASNINAICGPDITLQQLPTTTMSTSQSTSSSSTSTSTTTTTTTNPPTSSRTTTMTTTPTPSTSTTTSTTRSTTTTTTTTTPTTTTTTPTTTTTTPTPSSSTTTSTTRSTSTTTTPTTTTTTTTTPTPSTSTTTSTTKSTTTTMTTSPSTQSTTTMLSIPSSPTSPTSSITPEFSPTSPTATNSMETTSTADSQSTSSKVTVTSTVTNNVTSVNDGQSRSSGSGINMAIVIGASVGGGVLLIIIIVIVVFLFLSRQRRQKKPLMEPLEAFGPWSWQNNTDGELANGVVTVPIAGVNIVRAQGDGSSDREMIKLSPIGREEGDGLYKTVSTENIYSEIGDAESALATKVSANNDIPIEQPLPTPPPIEAIPPAADEELPQTMDTLDAKTMSTMTSTMTSTLTSILHNGNTTRRQTKGKVRFASPDDGTVHYPGSGSNVLDDDKLWRHRTMMNASDRHPRVMPQSASSRLNGEIERHTSPGVQQRSSQEGQQRRPPQYTTTDYFSSSLPRVSAVQATDEDTQSNPLYGAAIEFIY